MDGRPSGGEKLTGKYVFQPCQKLDEGGKQNGSVGGRTTKFLAVIGAVVVASNPDGQSVTGGGYPALCHIESTFATFLPQIHIMGNTYPYILNEP